MQLQSLLGRAALESRRHAVFAVVLVVAVALRILASPVSDAMAAPVRFMAHVLALAAGTCVYLLLVRWGVWRWLAAAATVPALWDASDPSREPFAAAFLVALVAAALLALFWRAGPSLRTTAVGGAALTAAVALYVSSYSEAAHSEIAGVRGAGVSTPAWLLFACLILGLVAAAGLGRAESSGLQLVCLLTAVVPAVMVFATAAAGNDARDVRVGHPTLAADRASAGRAWSIQSAGLLLIPAAGALGLTACLRGRRAASAGRRQFDDVDRAALAAFAERYGDPRLAPVAVVIAAYNEADGLPRVLPKIPETVARLRVDVIVVDDGSTDGTTRVVGEHERAYLVACPRNRGQGAALRLGYRVAREHGAQYIITTDADGQYDAADFPAVLAPILAGSADFVTGSRRLGHQQTVDRFRRAGVHVFAWIVSAFTGQWHTDTSFGLRAMRAHVTAKVTLNQPQYQSAELLLGVHSHGYRVAEVPATMHLRTAGSTKKGGNVAYGGRYARVVFGTWWREGCPAPARERAPALVHNRFPAHRAGPAVEPQTPWWARAQSADHRPFVVALAVAFVLRAIVVVAFPPGFVFSDGPTYLGFLDTFEASPSRPAGYDLFLLYPLSLVARSVLLIVTAQHLIGLATATLLYALLRRWGVSRWPATLAAFPVLFDSLHLLLEHAAHSDVLFEFVTVVALATLCWYRRPTPMRAFCAGLLLAGAVLVRLVGEPLVLAGVAYCLLVGVDWRRRLAGAAALVVGFSLPLAVYATWYHSQHGVYALSEFSGKSLYMRTTTFVDCAQLSIPEYQRVLCPREPLGERLDPTWYGWHDPVVKSLNVPAGARESDVMREFAVTAIRSQPGDYLRTALRDFILNFDPWRGDRFEFDTAEKWQFSRYLDFAGSGPTMAAYANNGGRQLSVNQPFADAMVQYQRVGYLTGPLLLACLLLGLAGAVGLRKARTSGLRSMCALTTLTGMGLILLPAFTANFIWRYQLPALALIPAGAALAYAALTGGRADDAAVTTSAAD
ncbi:MAG TPA: glycosyltransferase [Nocardioidaceae bacterium]|nr:glycosyltransferase [Nocardioidaceae bacterium]